tara:strand:- start:866 stop:1096 length:231 start_codon:yes stop_codon:yes gene_type:complete
MEIEQDLMKAVHIAKDQLHNGLEGMSRADLKEQYNLLVSLEVLFYKNFIKPYHEAIKVIDNADPQVRPVQEKTPSN